MCLFRVSGLTALTHCCSAVYCAATQHPLCVIYTYGVIKAFEISAHEDAPLKSKPQKAAKVWAVVLPLEQEEVTGRPLEHKMRIG